MFCKKGVLRKFTKFTGKHLCRPACNFIKRETLVQMLSREFCEMPKNTFFTEHLRTTGFCFKISESSNSYPLHCPNLVLVFKALNRSRREYYTSDGVIIVSVLSVDYFPYLGTSLKY